MKVGIEGRDRTGKDTQAGRLAKMLQCPVINFPNEKYKSGQRLRDILNKKEGCPFEPMSFQALQIINRMEAQEEIREAEEKYGNVIFCRNTLSGTVYALADGLPEEWVRKVMSFVPDVDVNIVLHGKPYCSDTGVYSESEYQEKIAGLYLQEIERNPIKNIMINIDGKKEEHITNEIILSLPDGVFDAYYSTR